MKRMTPFYAYRIYSSMKLHFGDTGYDLAKYDFRFMKMDENTFYNLKYKKMFDVVVKVIPSDKDWFNLLLCVFKDDSSKWIGDIAPSIKSWKDKSEKYIGMLEDMPNRFENELGALIEEMFIQRHYIDENFPNVLLDAFMNNDISTESFMIMEKLFSASFKKTLDNDPNYDYSYKFKHKNYSKIISFDLNKYRAILENLIIRHRPILHEEVTIMT